MTSPKIFTTLCEYRFFVAEGLPVSTVCLVFRTHFSYFLEFCTTLSEYGFVGGSVFALGLLVGIPSGDLLAPEVGRWPEGCGQDIQDNQGKIR